MILNAKLSILNLIVNNDASKVKTNIYKYLINTTDDLVKDMYSEFDFFKYIIMNQDI